MPERDYRFAFTPTGSKAHIVDFGRRSALAMGTRGHSDYAAACGEVPESWDEAHYPDDKPPSIRGQLCLRCADSVDPSVVADDA